MSKNALRVFKFILFAALLQLGAAAFAEVVVIVHPNNNNELNLENIKYIFLGHTNYFAYSEKSIPVEVESGPLHDKFTTEILQRQSFNLDVYWARMIFAGKATPSQKVNNELEVKTLVAKNLNMIGYVSRENVDVSVRFLDIGRVE